MVHTPLRERQQRQAFSGKNFCTFILGKQQGLVKISTAGHSELSARKCQALRCFSNRRSRQSTLLLQSVGRRSGPTHFTKNIEPGVNVILRRVKG
jgi:hypothetical protein